ncbi:efflux RND transporter periplasmic adaptor subunit [Paracoccus bogoriensis]|uniref:efflux RND transporter periplasmic adaptor subunit n=1 Tax=Paracoccus bogoriensis TaxID=242065 RepID=UPI001CA5112A|nr:efflux RND transporter periplasmic adaptor subunit [Paracoccus bogoriensis]MBW7056262.1 efflux RND transporter periplasmic adaptor subunit [Paracoccus bogoriensis]
MSRLKSSSTLVFLAIVALLVVWIGGGMLNRTPPEPPVRVEPPLPNVAAHLSTAERIQPRVVLYGNIVPNQTSILRARTAGIVEEVVRQGDTVEQGAQIARLSADDRQAGVARAEAELRSAERDHEAARQLRERGVTSEAELQSRFAALEAARAGLRAAELELDNTRLRAPITGTVSNVLAEVGSFVQAGGEVLEIVNNDPLIAQIEVRQNEITSVTLGQRAEVAFQGGREAEGRVSFISPVATPETRTFRVEIEIPNPDSAVPAGLSAEIALSLAERVAHRISPALVRLDDAGRIGVMIVEPDGETLRFAPIEIVQARAEAIWATGLPDEVQIVTISQGALKDGQRALVSETPEEFRNVLGGEAPAPAPGMGAGTGADPTAADAAAALIGAMDPEAPAPSASN